MTPTYKHLSDRTAMYMMSEQTTIPTLTTAVNVTLPKGATGILVQPFTEDVHINIGHSNVVATTSHFRLSTAMVSPLLIPLVEGTTVSFIENLPGATLSYMFVR